MSPINRDMIASVHEQALAVVRQEESSGRRTAHCFAKLAKQRVLLAQTGIALAKRGNKSEMNSTVENIALSSLLGRSAGDFAGAMELGYLASATEVRDWFSHALTTQQWPIGNFIAVMHPGVWKLGGKVARWQAFFGFSILRGEEDRTKRVLDYLQGLCFDGDVGKDQSSQAEFQRVTWRALDAIYRRDAVAFSAHLTQRVDLWPRALTEEQSEDCLYLYDLTALGFIRLAQMRGMTVNVSHPDLPLALLDAT